MPRSAVRAATPEAERPSGFRGAALRCAVPAGIVVAASVILYPIHGFRVAIGSDTPVYVWWTRLAGAAGVGGFGTGGRPAVIAAMAALSRLPGLSEAGVAASMAPAMAAAMGLAAAEFVRSASRSPDDGRIRFTLTVLFTGLFLSIMVAGYLSTLAFGTLLVTGLACLAWGLEPGAPRRPVAAAAPLLGLAVLAHLLFGFLAAAVLGGVAVALVPPWRRTAAAGGSLADSGFGRTLAAGAGAVAVVAVGFAVSAGGPKAPETSRDAVLRRSGLGHLIRASYRRKLVHDFPWWRWTAYLLAAGTALVAWLRTPGRRTRWRHPLAAWSAVPERTAALGGFLASWALITAGAIGALVANLSAAPGQRMATFCLPIPILAAIGLGDLWTRPTRAGRVAFWLVGAAFVVVAWLAWGGQRPLVTPEAVSQARAAGEVLAGTPPGTPLILVADDRSDKPGLYITRYENYLRGGVPARRIPDVHVFVGTPADLVAGRPTLTGEEEHDALARSSLAEVRPLLSQQPLVVAVAAFDATTYRHSAAMSGARQLAPGVVAIAGFDGDRPCPDCGTLPPALTDPGSGPMSPWLPVWLAPVLLLVLAALGFPWSRLAIPDAEPITGLALAPGFGLAAVALAALVMDAVGLRLADVGGWAALTLAATGWVLLALSPPRRAAPPATP
jgi:hypothetical protein